LEPSAPSAFERYIRARVAYDTQVVDQTANAIKLWKRGEDAAAGAEFSRVVEFVVSLGMGVSFPKGGAARGGAALESEVAVSVGAAPRGGAIKGFNPIPPDEADELVKLAKRGNYAAEVEKCGPDVAKLLPRVTRKTLNLFASHVPQGVFNEHLKKLEGFILQNRLRDEALDRLRAVVQRGDAGVYAKYSYERQVVEIAIEGLKKKPYDEASVSLLGCCDLGRSNLIIREPFDAVWQITAQRAGQLWRRGTTGHVQTPTASEARRAPVADRSPQWFG